MSELVCRFEAAMEHSEGSHVMYKCLWCDPQQRDSLAFRDLRVWFRIEGVQSSWIYDYCGMCENCVKSEWKEYRSDFNDPDPLMRRVVEQRAYENWSSMLSITVNKIKLQCEWGIAEELQVEYEASGGRRRLIRELRRQYLAKRSSS